MIDPAVLGSLAAELGSRRRAPHLRLAQLHGGPLHKAFVSLHAALENGATKLERQTRFAGCVKSLLEHCSEEPPAQSPSRRDRAATRRAKEYIDAHFSDCVSLDQLVAAAGSLSRFHLVRAFAKEFGLPPHAYQVHVRIARSRALIEKGMRIAEVAVDLGFADQSHFTRHFRTVVGVTPKTYQRQVAS
jgi:AraC-like DNA-binding protein